jgi:hypothetical protein
MRALTAKQALQLLRLCDKLEPKELNDLGAYLMACAYWKRKPTVGAGQSKALSNNRHFPYARGAAGAPGPGPRPSTHGPCPK